MNEEAGATPTFEESFAAAERAAFRFLVDNHGFQLAERQVARFLCGIASPALTAAKLTRHPRFGAAAEVPFAQVMESVKSTATTGG